MNAFDENVEIQESQSSAVAGKIKPQTPKEIADCIMNILEEHKAFDIKLLKVAEKTLIADYFILCSASSNTQVKSLAGEIEFKMGELGCSPIHADGMRDDNWVVIDYGSVMVHVFHRNAREFYNLEKLWCMPDSLSEQKDSQHE